MRSLEIDKHRNTRNTFIQKYSVYDDGWKGSLIRFHVSNCDHTNMNLHEYQQFIYDIVIKS